MAIVTMILRKMYKNKWLQMNLLLGLVVAVALVSSMPMYTEAILQRMLIKDLEQQQAKSGQYAAQITLQAQLAHNAEPAERKRRIEQAETGFVERLLDVIGLPVLQFVREQHTSWVRWTPVDPKRLDPDIRRSASFASKSGLAQQVSVIDGRLPASEQVDGFYEVVLFDRDLTRLKVLVGDELQVEEEKYDRTIKVRIVGVIDRMDNQDLYWQANASQNTPLFYMSDVLFAQDFLEQGRLPVYQSQWYGALDYSKFDLMSAQRAMVAYEQMQLEWKSSGFYYTSHRSPMISVLKEYGAKEEKLRTLLWSLNVPVFILLGFYLYMVANLMITRQKTEIAVLRSRGAGRLQIIGIYLAEGVLLGALAWVIGPQLAVIFTKMLGASGGFLQIVQRAALDVHLTSAVFGYAAVAVLVSLVLTLIPAIAASGHTIVEQKQDQGRSNRMLFWHRYGLDVILLVIAAYGSYIFANRMRDLLASGLDAADMTIDPLLFFVPALFILGAALFLLRLHPYVIRLLYVAGQRWWAASAYSSLIQVGRASGQYQFLMVFLILTLATGLFSASAARTINQNMEERIAYLNGADYVLMTEWMDNAPPLDPFAPPPEPTASEKIQYVEPPFSSITDLPEVEEAAKVFIKPTASLHAGEHRGVGTLMAIDTDDFGRTLWFRDGLLGSHINQYLNLMAGDSSAVLVSTTMAEAWGVVPGDTIYVGWQGVDSKPFTIFATVDYWPTFNPNPSSPVSKDTPPMLLVAHLDAVQTRFALEPYQVWLRLKEGMDSKALYASIEEHGIRLTALTDTAQQLVASRQDPFRLAINGVMTLGFLISCLISFLGFIIFWVLTLQGRLLQFGIFRAMGLSFRQLVGILLGEQLLTTGAALLLGTLIGQAVSRWYVPMFQLSFHPGQQVPPFQVVIEALDQQRLYGIVLVMMVIGIGLLAWLLSRVKIYQAVKLGED